MSRSIIVNTGHGIGIRVHIPIMKLQSHAMPIRAQAKKLKQKNRERITALNVCPSIGASDIFAVLEMEDKAVQW